MISAIIQLALGALPACMTERTRSGSQLKPSPPPATQKHRTASYCVGADQPLSCSSRVLEVLRGDAMPPAA